MSAETIAAAVSALMIARHPQWAGQEWIEQGVGRLCAEHAARDPPAVLRFAASY